MLPFRIQCLRRYRFGEKEKLENVKLRTHNFLDGGELSVSSADMDAFLDSYARAAFSGEHLFVVEQRSHPVYRMFFDVDCHLASPLQDAQLWYTKIAKYVMATLLELFSDSLGDWDSSSGSVSPLTLLCSVADAKTVRKNQQDLVKYGMHINVPGLDVTKDMALRIRDAVVQKLDNNMPTADSSWSRDIDAAVYESCGLRMMYSSKASKCRCTVKARDGCDKCNGTGRCNEGRPYTPLFEMSSSFEVAACPPQTTLECVRKYVYKSSIRSTAQEPSLRFNAAPPSWFEDSSGLFSSPEGLGDLLADGAAGRQRKRAKLTEGLATVEGSLQNKLVLAQPEHDRLQQWFDAQVARKVLPRQYRKVGISSCFSFTQNSIRSHVIARVDSQFCMNIGREHSTNTVYLLINLLTKKASMKCYCRCDTTEGRRTVKNNRIVMCKDYSSPTIDCSTLDLALLNRDTCIRPRVLALF
tara:strand:- start:2 stop:1408 length:1407 start_codon:yes stop_codon:yes gene_type:complete